MLRETAWSRSDLHHCPCIPNRTASGVCRAGCVCAASGVCPVGWCVCRVGWCVCRAGCVCAAQGVCVPRRVCLERVEERVHELLERAKHVRHVERVGRPALHTVLLTSSSTRLRYSTGARLLFTLLFTVRCACRAVIATRALDARTHARTSCRNSWSAVTLNLHCTALRHRCTAANVAHQRQA